MRRQDLIDKFLNDSLDKEEQLLFDDLFQSDEAFRADLNIVQNLHKAIGYEEKVRLKKRLQGLEKQKPYSKNLLKWKIILAIGLLFMILSLLYFIKDSRTTQPTFAEYYTTYPNTLNPIVRGPNSPSKLTEAFLAYEQGKFGKSAVMLDSLSALEDKVELRFYQAMSLLSDGKLSEGKALLESLDLLNTHYYLPQKWYMILLSLGEKDKNSTIRLIEEYLSFSPNNYKVQEAKILLNSLKE